MALREQPSTTSSIVGQLSVGDTFVVLRPGPNGWVKVQKNSKEKETGWTIRYHNGHDLHSLVGIENEWESWSISKLKEFLSNWGISTDDCLERSDLLAKVAREKERERVQQLRQEEERKVEATLDALKKGLGQEIRSNSIRKISDLLPELYHDKGDVGAYAVAQALKIFANSSVETISMRLQQIGDEEARALAGAINSNPSIKILDLASNRIGSIGAKALAEALSSNSTLTHFNLSMNSIRNEGAQALAKALSLNFTLHYLNVTNNSVGNEGAQALAEALKSNSTLLKLELSGVGLNPFAHGDIGDAGAQALAQALRCNSTLQELNLMQNKIGDAGAEALAAALQYNTVIMGLRLTGNKIGKVGKIALTNAKKQRKFGSASGMSQFQF